MSWPKDSFGLEGVPTFLPKGGWTPLMYAAREGATDAARTLAEAGADLNVVDAEKTSALLRAITNSHYDTAAALIEAGADPNLADNAGMAALYAATDMSSLGEVYGRPPRRVNDTHTAVDIVTLLLRARRRSECAAEVAAPDARPHAGRSGAWRGRHAADARRQERRLSGDGGAAGARRRRHA